MSGTRELAGATLLPCWPVAAIFPSPYVSELGRRDAVAKRTTTQTDLIALLASVAPATMLPASLHSANCKVFSSETVSSSDSDLVRRLLHKRILLLSL